MVLRLQYGLEDFDSVSDGSPLQSLSPPNCGVFEYPCGLLPAHILLRERVLESQVNVQDDQLVQSVHAVSTVLQI